MTGKQENQIRMLPLNNSLVMRFIPMRLGGFTTGCETH